MHLLQKEPCRGGQPPPASIYTGGKQEGNGGPEPRPVGTGTGTWDGAGQG